MTRAKTCGIVLFSETVSLWTGHSTSQQRSPGIRANRFPDRLSGAHIQCSPPGAPLLRGTAAKSVAQYCRLGFPIHAGVHSGIGSRFPPYLSHVAGIGGVDSATASLVERTGGSVPADKYAFESRCSFGDDIRKSLLDHIASVSTGTAEEASRASGLARWPRSLYQMPLDTPHSVRVGYCSRGLQTAWGGAIIGGKPTQLLLRSTPSSRNNRYHRRGGRA